MIYKLFFFLFFHLAVLNAQVRSVNLELDLRDCTNCTYFANLIKKVPDCYKINVGIDQKYKGKEKLLLTQIFGPDFAFDSVYFYQTKDKLDIGNRFVILNGNDTVYRRSFPIQQSSIFSNLKCDTELPKIPFLTERSRVNISENGNYILDEFLGKLYFLDRAFNVTEFELGTCDYFRLVKDHFGFDFKSKIDTSNLLLPELASIIRVSWQGMYKYKGMTRIIAEIHADPLADGKRGEFYSYCNLCTFDSLGKFVESTPLEFETEAFRRYYINTNYVYDKKGQEKILAGLNYTADSIFIVGIEGAKLKQPIISPYDFKDEYAMHVIQSGNDGILLDYNRAYLAFDNYEIVPTPQINNLGISMQYQYRIGSNLFLIGIDYKNKKIHHVRYDLSTHQVASDFVFAAFAMEVGTAAFYLSNSDIYLFDNTSGTLRYVADLDLLKELSLNK